MRLRQIAFVAKELQPIADHLGAVFGLKVGFRDPAVEFFGLHNVVMPVGGEFLEVVAPFRDDASGARYLARQHPPPSAPAGSAHRRGAGRDRGEGHGGVGAT